MFIGIKARRVMKIGGIRTDIQFYIILASSITYIYVIRLERASDTNIFLFLNRIIMRSPACIIS